MDIPQLAADVAKFIAPFLPYLIEGGRIAAKAAFEAAGKKFAESAWEQAEGLWGKINPKVKTDPKTEDAFKRTAQKPEDKREGILEMQFEDMFNEDTPFKLEVEKIYNITNEINIGQNVSNSVIMAGTGNQFTQAEVLVQGNLYIGAQPQSDEEALEIYRGYTANMTSNVSTSGLNLKADATSGAKEQMRLANIYIELDTKTQIEIPVKKRGKTKSAKNEPSLDEQALLGREEKMKPLSVLEAVTQNQRLVIKGDPGSGKSTFVNFLAYCLSSKRTNLLDKTWRKQDLLPVIVILRDFAKTIPEEPKQATARHLCDFIEEMLANKKLSFASAPIFKLLEQGKVLVFLDGLDEVQSVERRIFVRDAVREFSARYGKNRFVATCRVLSYQEPKEEDEPDLRLIGFPDFEVAPFTREKINLFIDHWYLELMDLNMISKNEADESVRNLKAAAHSRRELQKLAPNPLLLTVMAIVNTYRGKLPDSRVYLYQDAIDILLWQWERKNKNQEARLRQLLTEANKNEADLQKVIRKLAFEAHAQTTQEEVKNNTLAGISELALEKALAKINKGDRNWAAEVIEAMRLRAGLLLERDTGIFTFPHRSFQEFLAGASIDSEDHGNFVSIADDLANNLMVWREAILWAVGLCVNTRGNLTNPLMLAAKLCPSTPPKDQNDWLRVWFAGDVLLEAGLARIEEDDLGKNSILPRVQNRLVELLENSHLTSRERAEAGNTLAKLGDPRFDETHWSLPKESLLGFVHIPAGEFWMGTKEEDIKSLIEKFGGKQEYYKPEVPQHKLHLSDFYMARYPVTAAQFKTFVQDSGHEPENKSSLLGVLNHPVRYVTWYEAMKYCEWLTGKLKSIAPTSKAGNEAEETFWRGIESGKFIATLPSEAEWEKAARGDKDDRAFPWGNDVNLDKVNGNMVIGDTSSVGCFPLGKSPYEIHDMSGNVWEWTRSNYNPYPYDKDDGRENIHAEKNVARVVRGGAYLFVGWYLRCVSRYRLNPFNEWSNRGFRVVVASFPISLPSSGS